MRYFAPLAMLTLMAGVSSAGSQESAANVNSRYTIESVELVPDRKALTTSLREAMQNLIGEKFDQQVLNDLARKLRKELRVDSLIQKVVKGSKPEHVRVIFETRGPRGGFDVNLPKLAYHSKQGFSGGIEATQTIHDNRFSFGVRSDGDEKIERFAGINFRYENRHVFTDRVRLQFDFQSFHNQWNGATLAAIEQQTNVPGIYRTRQNFQPMVTVSLAEPLTFSTGVSLQNFETQFPVARTEAANAVVNTLRYRRRWEPWGATHDLDAGYQLRAATRTLDSDFVYARHETDVRYLYDAGSQEIILRFQAGTLNGRAPIFDRFVLGTTRTLRGWNKFDLVPLGAERMVHGSVEYHWHDIMVFYDTGSAWDRGQPAKAKHSAGIGVSDEGGFFLALAFPIRQGRVAPMFMIGFNY
jgi:hypothetical protein